MFLDFYVIQNVPPCNVNRDDVGTPKTAIYGGCLRSRVSSQSWKHAMRTDFPQYADRAELGYRTKNAVALISQRISELRPDISNADILAANVLALTGVKLEKSNRSGSDKGQQVTQYLLFISTAEIDRLARFAIDAHDTGKELTSKDNKRKLTPQVKAFFDGTSAIDIALFGRMLADAADLNVDAAAQVAHAISVNRVTPEYDFFTAVDDCAADDNAGAAMMGTVAFDSSTLYRYATLDIDSLYQQLGDAEVTAKAAKVFAETFVKSMPTGKQHAFAHRTLPSAVLVALRAHQSINGVSAFETPVRAKEDASIDAQAEDLLASRLMSIADVYDEAPVHAWWCAVDGGCDSLRAFGDQKSFSGILDALSESVLASIKADD